MPEESVGIRHRSQATDHSCWLAVANMFIEYYGGSIVSERNAYGRLEDDTGDAMSLFEQSFSYCRIGFDTLMNSGIQEEDTYEKIVECIDGLRPIHAILEYSGECYHSVVISGYSYSVLGNTGRITRPRIVISDPSVSKPYNLGWKDENDYRDSERNRFSFYSMQAVNEKSHKKIMDSFPGR